MRQVRGGGEPGEGRGVSQLRGGGEPGEGREGELTCVLSSYQLLGNCSIP